MRKRLLYKFNLAGVSAMFFLSFVLVLCQPFVFPSLAHGLSISHAVCSTENGTDEEPGLSLLAEVLDDSGSITSDASVWVIAPDGERFNLEYEPSLGIYYGKGDVSIVLGDYTFHAELDGDTAAPMIKTLSSSRILGLQKRVILKPQTPQHDKPLKVSWSRIRGARGYFVALINNETNQLVWSNVSSLWSRLPRMRSVIIPPGTMAPATDYSLIILASNNPLIENASAISGVDIGFTPGQPFNMDTVSVATNSYPHGKFITLQVFLEDYFGGDIEKAMVWATYPSGKIVSFIHNINGWYEPQPSDRPDPEDDQSFGTYLFYASYGGEQMTRERVLQNYFLPVPTNVTVNPWPLVRNEAFSVTWDPVPGATAYEIAVNEKVSGKILYDSPSSATPSHYAPAEIWDYLTPGNKYVILTHSLDKEGYSEASATSFYVVDFTAP